MRATTDEIDLGLAVLEVLTPAGTALSQGDIADVCGCSRSCIYLIELSALKKLRRHLQRNKNAELRDALLDMMRRAA